MTVSSPRLMSPGSILSRSRMAAHNSRASVERNRAISGEGHLLLGGDSVQLRAAPLPGRRFELAAGGHDVAATRTPDRRADPGREHDLGKAPDPLLVRTFIAASGPGVERDQVHLRRQLVLADQPDQLARIVVAVVLVLEH